MLTSILGRIVYPLVAPSFRDVCMDGFFAGQGPSTWIAQLVRKEIIRRYHALPDPEKRRVNRERFWGAKPALNWHEMKRELYVAPEQFNSDFLRFREPLAAQVRELVRCCPELDTLCQFGTGHGLFLHYLSTRVPGIRRFVGLDLCAEQIRLTRERYRETPLEFLHMEAMDWLRGQAGKGVVFVAVGTLQYFTPEELQEFLRAVREMAAPGAIAISETVSVRLTSAVRSTPRGDINYNHPYPELFRRERYHLFRHEIIPVAPAAPPHSQVILTAATCPMRNRAPQEVAPWEPTAR